MYGQINSIPFTHITVQLHAFSASYDTPFRELWASESGLGTKVETPFYFGFLDIELRVSEHNTRNSMVSDFQKIEAAFGWNNKLRVTKKINIKFGGHFLLSRFTLKNMSENQIALTERLGLHGSESENGLSINGALLYNLDDRWTIEMGVTRRTIYTSTNIKGTYFDLGFARKFQTPKWLVNVLK